MSLFGGCNNNCDDSLLWFIILFLLLFCTGINKKESDNKNCNDEYDCGCSNR